MLDYTEILFPWPDTVASKTLYVYVLEKFLYLQSPNSSTILWCLNQNLAEGFIFGETNKTDCETFLNFPLGKFPAFETSDRNYITENNAIVYYVANEQLNFHLFMQTCLDCIKIPILMQRVARYYICTIINIVSLFAKISISIYHFILSKYTKL